MAITSRVLSLFAITTTLACVAAATDNQTTPAAAPNPNPSAILVLGGHKHNAHGSLGTGADGLTFESKGKTTKIASTSLERLSVGSNEHETGGIPMTAAKMAIPYGGGRVVSLFAHEKYDTLTVEYRDENGGYHGMLFNLPKGQADSLQTAVGQIAAKTPAAPMAAADKDNSGWAIEVEPVNPGDTAVSAEFLVATYEHLIEELEKSHKYVAVLRGGDSNAAKYGKLLVLKTDVQKFVHGNEQARAVTTVKGWTKLAVTMHLQTADGRAVLDKDVVSNVRFYGNNLRATKTIASSMVNSASTATMPQ
ncbi:MAG TPA: hypothetical protein VGL89_11095 [Candidatus Koribacter sp.]|jgi:hypothetical protein